MSTLVEEKNDDQQRIRGMTGDEAVAEALKLIEPDVVAAYPITPQTIIVERFSEFWADGVVDTEFVSVESEHSAMSASVGASATGARVFTASSSQGIALMYEILFIAAGNRLPIVMAVANRALSSPINIHGELTDQLVCRDTGWISWFGENAQEAYDHTIMAFKVAEHPDVQLPVMYGIEGFIVSHAVEPVETLFKDEVKQFLGDHRIPHAWTFRPGNPGAQALLALPDYYMELKYQQQVAMERALQVIPEVFKEFGDLTGRYYHLVEPYRLDDAEYAFVTMGATSGTAKAVVDDLRNQGHPVGLLKIRCYRPFPVSDVVNHLKHLKGVMVVDRSVTFGSVAGILHSDVLAATARMRVPLHVSGRIIGLGGRDVLEDDFEVMYQELKQEVEDGMPSTVKWQGLRE